MKRAVLLVTTLLASAGSARSATAQIAGMPVWNSPRGGTGVLIAGDVGLPDSLSGKGSTVAARVALGLRSLTLSATAGSRNPSGTAATVTEYGGNAAYRLVGGSLIPISINLQAGASSYTDVATYTRVVGAMGFAIDLPVPGITLEPWVAPGIRMNHRGSSGTGPAQSNTNFGIAGGVTLGFGMFGLHAAVDYENLPGGGHTTTLGIGAHVDIRPRLGL